ncbi:MAG: helix-turn-helix transcriptional regulator [Alteromonadaceae bacterium]|nr:helix-turn-helix transcriptional regulator [Alteromonadaceae bacterium]
MGISVFVLMQISLKSKTRQTLYLLGLQLLLLIHIWGELFIYSGAYVYAPSLAGAQFPVRMLLGPALYFYAHATMSPVKQLSKRAFFVGLLGPLIVIIGMLPFLLGISAEEKLALANPATRDPDLYRIALYTCIFAMVAFASYTGAYLYAAFKLQRNHSLQLMTRFSDVEKRSMNWFKLLLMFWGLSWMLFILDFGLGLFGLRWFGSDVLLPVFEAIVLMVFSLFALRQPIIKDSEKGISTQQEKRQPSLAPDRMEAVSGKLKSAMQNDLLYLEDDLSLKKLSEHVNVSENHISETLSQCLNTNFYHFVNEFRIEHAKSNLLTSTKTVAEIAYASGFNSKSTFNTAFKKITNVTPTAFRNEHSLQSKSE